MCMDSLKIGAMLVMSTISVMNAYAIICFSGAFLLAVAAIRHQRVDFIPFHGNSMGGEIVELFLWALASLLAAAGSAFCIPWFLSPLIFIAGVVLSFIIRYCVDNWSRHLEESQPRGRHTSVRK